MKNKTPLQPEVHPALPRRDLLTWMATAGAALGLGTERVGGRYCLYRCHLESPIAFRKSIRVTMEHGHANHRSDNFFTTAYWYQSEPHAAFPALPSAEARIPRIIRVGGPGAAAPPPEK